MSTAALISVEEHLRTAYDPDCDYVDGEVIERNEGEIPHGQLQFELAHLFRIKRPEWKTYAYVETRLQVSDPVPDTRRLCLYRLCAR